MSDPLRFVVMGQGRAGSARIRAIEAHPGAELAGVLHQGDCADPERLAAALRALSSDVAVVCTPNALHVPQCEVALQAGLHVLMEFPLAPGARSARSLLERARATGRVLHVGHIELLAPSQEAQRERAAMLGRPVGGQLHFRGGVEGWIGDDALAGSPALRGLARLHRLVDLFGEVRIREASLTRRSPGYRLEVTLAFTSARPGSDAGGPVQASSPLLPPGGTTRLVEERGPDLPRATTWQIECERGVLGPPPDVPARGVFAQDLDHMIQRVAGRTESYLAERLELHVLEQIEEIDARVTG